MAVAHGGGAKVQAGAVVDAEDDVVLRKIFLLAVLKTEHFYYCLFFLKKVTFLIR